MFSGVNKCYEWFHWCFRAVLDSRIAILKCLGSSKSKIFQALRIPPDFTCIALQPWKILLFFFHLQTSVWNRNYVMSSFYNNIFWFFSLKVAIKAHCFTVKEAQNWWKQWRSESHLLCPSQVLSALGLWVHNIKTG